MSEALAVDTRAEADATPQKEVRRWLLEIKLSQKREKAWRETARATIDTYRGKKRKKNSFNILWANTEHLRPALYNSTPKPDVRRRFRQNDVLGKAVAEVAERSISYCVDAYDLDNCLQSAVLDALLPGRGQDRVRYVPKFKTSEAAQSFQQATAEPSTQPGAGPSERAEEAFQGDREEVEYEQALCEHVQWDDFLHGPGKTWEEVQWVAFAHNLTRDAQIEKFGEKIAGEITLDDVADGDLNDKSLSDDEKKVFKTSRFWEIWDKEGEKVFFLNESYRKGVIYPEGEKGDPPLKLKNFFPCPRPLQLVEDTGTLVPSPLYELYREQAEELDRVSTRINKIINACRVRFVHDSTLTELKALMDAGDNEGIPTESARQWMQNGGLDKAIWFMPIEQIAAVLRELYVARDSAKEVIYEITGISDIIRGVSNPNETLGAQKLKSNSASLRLQRMQREVQRYTRDLIRLLAEVIGENFDPQTLAQMTGLQFPTAMMKQQAQLQQQAPQQPQQPGQPPAQPDPKVQQMLAMPTWEDIMAVFRSDMQREYRVDVETDSTVAQSLQQDMEGIKEVLTSVVEVIQGFGPAVQAGAVSAEAVKAIIMSVVRRARMGLEVEDALEAGIQEPKPQADPKAAAMQAKAQADAAKQQHDQQLAAQKQAHDQQVAQRQQAHEEQIAQRTQMFEQQKAQSEAAAEERRLQMEARLEQQRMTFEEAANNRRLQMEESFQRFKALLDSITKVEVAEISAGATLDAAQVTAAKQGVAA